MLCRLKWCSKHDFLTQPLIRNRIIRVKINRRESMAKSLLILNKNRNCVWRKPVLLKVLLLHQLLHLDLQKHLLILRDLVTKSFRISLSRKSSKRLIFAPKSSSLNLSPVPKQSAYRRVYSWSTNRKRLIRIQLIKNKRDRVPSHLRLSLPLVLLALHQLFKLV